MRIFFRLLLPFLLLPGLQAQSAPQAVLWEQWLPTSVDATLSPDYTPWQAFLDRRIRPQPDAINRVDYQGVSAPERQALANYLDHMQQLDVSRLTRRQQLAYWINLYNAGTVKVILDHYPVASIRDIDISPGLFSDGPWGRKLFVIQGTEVSLDDIEHRILRPIWKDNRLHYAVNCASIGCPNLQPQAFNAANAERLLDKAAHDYINHPRGARVDRGRLYVSSIYRWFEEDFGGSEEGVIQHLRRFADATLKQQLSGVSEIADDDYDWSLNELQ